MPPPAVGPGVAFTSDDAPVLRPDNLDLPGVPPSLWPLLQAAACPNRIALVGGAVRDWLLHHQHLDPWRGLVDLDLVIEDVTAHGRPAGTARPDQSSPAWRLVEHLSRVGEAVTVRDARPHGQYGTVELELELEPTPVPGSTPCPGRLLLDVASARSEAYPIPAENPVVHFGALEDDLARRDLTINAMAIDLATGRLFDPHGGQADLAERRLRFLHPTSLEDDPTRLVRAARYAARLDFELAPESARQARVILAAWPWCWRAGDPPGQAPAALGTRLRREFELLLERENWRVALERLQEWGGLQLLDPRLQQDPNWLRRLQWASRFGLPPLVALIAVAQDPLALAERLQMPHRHHTLLRQLEDLRHRLAQGPLLPEGPGGSTSWRWCQLLESPGLSPAATALALASGWGPRRPLLRWLLRWRHLGPECTAQELIAAGVPPGPELGERLRRSRQRRLDRERS
ncbi:MAG: hypothetical protein RLZZ609_2279 [Cyanobacteriota bacterium]